jgi:hypothetical protein
MADAAVVSRHCETQLFEREHLAGPGEGGQKSRIGNVVGGAAEARVEATKEAEDKLGVLDGFADIPKSGSLDLEFLAVLVDCRVALLRKTAWGARLERKRPSMATHSSPAVWFSLVRARSRTESSTMFKIQLRMVHSAMSHDGSAGEGRRLNFPHRDLKNEAHLVKLGFFISKTTGMWVFTLMAV